jgi:hypothetical protein
MNIHNKTFLLIGVALVLGSMIWSSIAWHDPYMYRIGLLVVGVTYMVLAFNKPKESKG